MWYSNLAKIFVSSTNIDTFVPSLYKCVITRSIEVSASSASLFHHLRLSNVLKGVYRLSREPLYTKTHSTLNIKHFFMNILCIVSFCQHKNRQQNAAPQWNTPEVRSPFGLLKRASEHAHVRLSIRLPWSWIVLLPSGTHRKPITPITSVLHPFVTCLLTREWPDPTCRNLPCFFLSLQEYTQQNSLSKF
jgi:hypothetical protein